MKRIKQLVYLLVLSNVLYFSACSDDEGPAGSTSTSDDRDDFVGLWSVQETSSIFGSSVYDSEIQKNSSIEANVAIDNLYQLGIGVITQAQVDGNRLTIPTQTISDQVIQGSGSLVDSKTIELNYTADDGAEVDSVTCVYSKR